MVVGNQWGDIGRIKPVTSVNIRSRIRPSIDAEPRVASLGVDVPPSETTVPYLNREVGGTRADLDSVVVAGIASGATGVFAVAAIADDARGIADTLG